VTDRVHSIPQWTPTQRELDDLDQFALATD